MKLHTSNRALRRALNIKGCSPEQHQQEIERLRQDHGHSIHFVASRHDETCGPYAFGLTDHLTYRCIAGLCDVFAGKDYMRWVGARLREIAGTRKGWRHVGVITASNPDRVVSKWETYPRYEHEIAEVSEEYGDDVRLFARPFAQRALVLFVEFAHECDITDEDIAAARAEWRE